MKNTHIEHPEDSILTGDLSVLDWFIAESNISAKIDGAPAIVWGTNPSNGKFFVGTKSVFNKVKIKINHSHAEIDTNHQGNVATILHKCLDNLFQLHNYRHNQNCLLDIHMHHLHLCYKHLDLHMIQSHRLRLLYNLKQ